MMPRGLLSLIAVCGCVAESYTCDEEYGKHCPEEAPGAGLVSCLQKAGEKSDSCQKWVKMMVACKDDLGKFCQGNEADAFLCLSQWTKESDLSAECVETLPKKEKPKEEKKSRASQKRKAYQQHMKELKARKKAEKLAEKKKKEAAKKKKGKKKKKSKKKNKEL